MILRPFDALRDVTVRSLIHLADHATRRSRVPNPMAATRLLLSTLADQNLSGDDVAHELSWGLRRLGFTWPAALCGECHGPLTEEQARGDSPCSACSADAVPAS